MPVQMLNHNRDSPKNWLCVLRIDEPMKRGLFKSLRCSPGIVEPMKRDLCSKLHATHDKKNDTMKDRQEVRRSKIIFFFFFTIRVPITGSKKEETQSSKSPNNEPIKARRRHNQTVVRTGDNPEPKT
jgi:hypothetical protein